MPETNFVSIEELKFDEKGLIPAVVVDSESKKVLTVAYMNAESLKISMEKELLVPVPSGTVAEGGDQQQLSAHRLHHDRL